jgi:acyl-CoA synthetase (NDP forming)
LADLDEAPELVALCVPPAGVEAVVDEALAMGVRGFLGITAGIVDEPALAAKIRTAGARLVGANSLGLVDSATDLRLAWGRFTAGPLAIVSQSGQVGSELANLGARQGLGISRFVSVGNQSDVTATEILADLAAHDQTRIIALYLESFAGAEQLFETLQAIGKPTLLLTVGTSAASSRLARSHTGSLTSSSDIVDAACRAHGVLRVRTPAELITVARAFLTTKTPAGRRVAIVADSGGQGGIAADHAALAGLEVPTFSESVSSVLKESLPVGAATANPVDLAGAGEQDLCSYAETVAVAAQDVDAVVLTGYFGCYAVDTPALADAEREAARQLAKVGKPLIVHTMDAESSVARGLWALGVPAFPTIEAAISATAGLAGLAVSARKMPSMVSTTKSEAGGYLAARDWLTAQGIPFPSAALYGEAAFDPPYVLKAGWLDHKTEVGGVRVGLPDRESLAVTYEEMRARLGDGEYVVEAQDVRKDVVEMLVGVRRDPDFGSVVVVGAGGTAAEVHRDVALELAPVSQETALEMIESLRCNALLRGWRGRPAADSKALARLVADISQLSKAFVELELNPVRVGPDGVLAVDALLVRKEGAS